MNILTHEIKIVTHNTIHFNDAHILDDQNKVWVVRGHYWNELCEGLAKEGLYDLEFCLEGDSYDNGFRVETEATIPGSFREKDINALMAQFRNLYPLPS